MRILGERTVVIRRTVVLAAAVGVVLLVWPGADAKDTTVARHRESARVEGGRHRKAAAVEELCRIDSFAARAAIKDLADAEDDTTAIVAMQALSREDFSGARAKLKDIFEDGGRSDLARSMAIVALLHGRKQDGDAWGGIARYVSTHTSVGSMVREAAIAAAAKHWPAEVNGE